MLLIGDIGGTNTRLALISASGRLDAPVVEATFPSQRYHALEEVVTEFLSGHPQSVERAVFAVAGPVVAGRARLTNLAWDVEEERLRKALGLTSVRLLNDLLALAHAIPQLTPQALSTLQPGAAEPRGGIAVVAPGTGLGEAFLVWDGSRYRAHPSEGGHADFAPTDALQRELLAWLAARSDHVSSERVCSGRGIPTLHAFLRERGTWHEEEWLAERLAAADDPTPVILGAALDTLRPSPLCAAAVELFAAILAAEAGNAALRLLATGGVYLGGGLPRRMLPLLERPDFLARFRSKGRMASLLERIPLHVVTARKVALLGAARAARTEET